MLLVVDHASITEDSVRLGLVRTNEYLWMLSAGQDVLFQRRGGVCGTYETKMRADVERGGDLVGAKMVGGWWLVMIELGSDVGDGGDERGERGCRDGIGCVRKFPGEGSAGIGLGRG